MGIGIAWFFALLRVIRRHHRGRSRALGIYLFNRHSAAGGTGPVPAAGPQQPPDIPTVPLRRE
jgi:hypothetical protein